MSPSTRGPIGCISDGGGDGAIVIFDLTIGCC
jgi:hypothetical protein